MNSRLKWMLAVAFLLVFAAGAATGSFAGSHYFKKHKKRLNFKAHGAVSDRMQEHLRTELELTPEQTEKVAPIIQSTTDKLQAIRIETAARVRETMEEAGREMSPHLTPDQQKKLAELREKHRDHLKIRRFRGRGRGRPPHSEPPES